MTQQQISEMVWSGTKVRGINIYGNSVIFRRSGEVVRVEIRSAGSKEVQIAMMGQERFAGYLANRCAEQHRWQAAK